MVDRYRVGRYLGDTTQSLGYLAAGEVDMAVTCNNAAEVQVCKSGVASERVSGFRVVVFCVTYHHRAMAVINLVPLFPGRSDVGSREPQKVVTGTSLQC